MNDVRVHQSLRHRPIEEAETRAPGESARGAVLADNTISEEDEALAGETERRQVLQIDSPDREQNHVTLVEQRTVVREAAARNRASISGYAPTPNVKFLMPRNALQ